MAGSLELANNVFYLINSVPVYGVLVNDGRKSENFIFRFLKC